jgi:uncharacterized membrane protein
MNNPAGAKTMTLAISYVAALVFFAVVDLTWLTLMSSRFYKPILGDIMAVEVNLPAAAVFYLFYPIGLMIFAISPALKSGDLKTAALMGALFGLFAYGTYDLTNHATLRNWSTSLTVTDMAWGAFVSGLTATFAAWVGSKFA